jgi:hypothetical protein
MTFRHMTRGLSFTSRAAWARPIEVIRAYCALVVWKSLLRTACLGHDPSDGIDRSTIGVSVVGLTIVEKAVEMKDVKSNLEACPPSASA